MIKISVYSITHTEHEKYDFSFPERRALHFCALYISPIMIALKIYKRDLYEDFVSGNNPKPLFDNLSNFTYRFNGLLERDESFEAEGNKTIVTFEQKLLS